MEMWLKVGLLNAKKGLEAFKLGIQKCIDRYEGILTTNGYILYCNKKL